MRKRELEIALENVKPFGNPNANLEQYVTPATIAADIVFHAYLNGDVSGLKIIDLGCGTGMLSIACALMDAGMVVGFDTDGDALLTAENNASEAGVRIEFVQSDISDVCEHADTAIMNPPFGCQKEHADRPFLEKALTLADCSYSVHMEETLDFVEKFASSHGKSVFWRRTYKYDIPHQFSFHTKKKQTVEVAAVGIR